MGEGFHPSGPDTLAGPSLPSQPQAQLLITALSRGRACKGNCLGLGHSGGLLSRDAAVHCTGTGHPACGVLILGCAGVQPGRGGSDWGHDCGPVGAGCLGAVQPVWHVGYTHHPGGEGCPLIGHQSINSESTKHQPRD